MDRRIIPVAALLVAFCIVGVAHFVFPLEAISENEEMRIDDFRLRPVQNGDALEFVLEGTGFGPDPRVSLSLDIANRSSVTGTFKIWGALQDVAVDGEIAVLANGNRGVQIADISDPDRPFILGSVDVPGMAMDVDIMGTLAYVACARGGVSVVDFSLPENPFVVGKLFLPGVAWDLEMIGDYLYVAGGKDGLHVVDIARPAALRHLTSLPMEGDSFDLASLGSGVLMVAAVKGGLKLVDITDPAHPQISGAMDLGGAALAVAFGDGLGFAADVNGQLYILDVRSDSGQPPILGTIELLGKPSNLTYRNGRVLAAAISGVHVVDVSLPDAPKLEGTVGMRNARGVATQDGRIYVANSKGGLAVVDESTIQPLQAIDYFVSKGNALGLKRVDRTLYLSDGFGGLKILEIDVAGRLQMVGKISLPGKTRDVELKGDYAYAANYEGGLDTLDISRPREPRLLGSVETMGLAMDLRFHDGLALVVTNKLNNKPGRTMVNGLQIFDLADPARPQLLSSLPLEQGSGIDVAVDEEQQTAYLIAGTGGVVAVDISDPRSPVIVGRYSMPWPEYSFSPMISGAYRNGILYVANGRNGLVALDVTDRTKPAFVGVLSTMASATGVSLKGDRAYLSLKDEGIAVADIGNPKDMRVIARMEVPVYARQLVVDEERVMFGNGHRGLFVVPAPIEAEILSATPTKLVCRFPTPAMPGNFSLSVFGENSSSEIFVSLP